MSIKIGWNFAGGFVPMLCIGVTSDGNFCIWGGGLSGGVPAGGFANRIPAFNSGKSQGGWSYDVHRKSYSIDIDTINSLNSPSPRHIPGSQDNNSMLHVINARPPRQAGGKDHASGPPDKGCRPLGRPRAAPAGVRPPSWQHGRTRRARVWFPRHNSDARQDTHAPRPRD
jgi:hypothetical protein